MKVWVVTEFVKQNGINTAVNCEVFSNTKDAHEFAYRDSKAFRVVMEKTVDKYIKITEA